MLRREVGIDRLLGCVLRRPFATLCHLQTLKLDGTYDGVEEVDGDKFEMEEAEDRRPFTALLDIGLICTTTGNKVFAVMKGTGEDIPNIGKRFPVYSKDEGFEPE